jgi:hypothetical protein
MFPIPSLPGSIAAHHAGVVMKLLSSLTAVGWAIAHVNPCTTDVRRFERTPMETEQLCEAARTDAPCDHDQCIVAYCAPRPADEARGCSRVIWVDGPSLHAATAFCEELLPDLDPRARPARASLHPAVRTLPVCDGSPVDDPEAVRLWVVCL